MGFNFNQTQTEATPPLRLPHSTLKPVRRLPAKCWAPSIQPAYFRQCPGSGNALVGPSFWAEDDYKVTPKLTLNIGLRWDIYPSIREAHNIFTFLNPNGINSITGNRGTLEFAGNGNPRLLQLQLSVADLFQELRPTLGLAWSVDPKTVIRASYNVNFARGNWTSGSQSGSPSTLGFTPVATAPGGISSAPAFYWDGDHMHAGSRMRCLRVDRFGRAPPRHPLAAPAWPSMARPNHRAHNNGIGR